MKPSNKLIIYWLLAGCLLIFLMVIVGGVTRLTHSGLSISNYNLITGALPPLSETEWQKAFELYQQYPEYQKLNTHFDLSDFKNIYFWEWLHRLIGRLIGIIFLIPFIYFLIKKQLNRATTRKTIIIGLMGGFQGFLGWYMVKSGLVDRPDVSHFRLAAHLITAFATFAYTLWTALGFIHPIVIVQQSHRSIKRWIQATIIILFLQMTWGAFVAGLDAGEVHNHWPMMNEEKFIHPTVWSEYTPTILNFVEGKSGVQFVHRMGAIILLIFIAIIVWKALKINLKKDKSSDFGRLRYNSILAITSLISLQFILGILTLLYAVPLLLGLAHQIIAFVLLSTVIYSLYIFSERRV